MWDVAVFMAISVVFISTVAAFTILLEMLRHVRHERRIERDRERRLAEWCRGRGGES